MDWNQQESEPSRNEEMSKDLPAYKDHSCLLLSVICSGKGIFMSESAFQLTPRRALKSISRFHPPSFIRVLVFHEELKLKINPESRLLQILSDSCIHKTVTIYKHVLFSIQQNRVTIHQCAQLNTANANQSNDHIYKISYLYLEIITMCF